MKANGSPRRPIRLKDRDFDIMVLLGELGHVPTPVIWKRFWDPATTVRSCQERMKRLAEHDLVRSVELEVAFAGENGGRQPALHSLTPRGAELVEQHTGNTPRRVLRKDLKPMTFLHRREVVESRLAWDEGCQLSGLAPPAWIHEQDCRPNVPDGASPVEHRLLYHAFGEKKKRVTCRPDAATLTVIPGPVQDGQAASVQLVTWWEIDRGTEGLSQIRRKVPGYQAAFQKRVFRQYGWGELRDPVVRLLWVCPDKRRLEFLRETLRSFHVAQYFRFITRKLLDPRTVLTEPVWTDPDGRQRSILRRSAISRETARPE